MTQGPLAESADTTARDIENAEKMFFETVRRIKLEREQRAAYNA